MKRIIYRSKETGKIFRDCGYEELLRSCGSRDLIDKELHDFNSKQSDSYVEIVELDDVAEFYFRQSRRYNEELDSIANRLHSFAGDIDFIADEIEKYC